jgi:hypothetical protein
MPRAAGVLISRWRGTVARRPEAGRPRVRERQLDAGARSRERRDAARGRASSRSDLDGLDERPPSLRDRLATRAPFVEHQRDRVLDHRPRVVQIRPLGLDFGKLRDVRVDPALARIFVYDAEAECAHVPSLAPCSDTKLDRGGGVTVRRPSPARCGQCVVADPPRPRHHCPCPSTPRWQRRQDHLGEGPTEVVPPARAAKRSGPADE